MINVRNLSVFQSFLKFLSYCVANELLSFLCWPVQIIEMERAVRKVKKDDPNADNIGQLKVKSKITRRTTGSPPPELRKRRSVGDNRVWQVRMQARCLVWCVLEFENILYHRVASILRITILKYSVRMYWSWMKLVKTAKGHFNGLHVYRRKIGLPFSEFPTRFLSASLVAGLDGMPLPAVGHWVGVCRGRRVSK